MVHDLSPSSCPVEAVLPRWLPIAFAAALLPLMLWVSPDFGVTWDEWPRQAYGERIWRFYAGQETHDAFPADGTHLHGGLFELSVVALQRLLPLDRYVVRHGLNALFGWFGVVGCGVLTARLAGRDVALLAMLLLALLPRYFGHSMNNPKDVPFASLAIWVLVVMAGISTRYPYLRWTTVAGLIATIGLALSVRPGALLFLAYAAAVVGARMLRARDVAPKHVVVTAALLALVALLATTVPLPFWPWLQTRPYIGLIDALRGVSHFEWRGVMLFNGREIHAMRAPWTYIPVWLLYTTPLVTLGGLALSVPLLRRGSPVLWALAGLWAAVLFPIVYVIARHSTIYDEVRHLLFIQPPMVVIAALGWQGILRARRRLVAGTAAALLAAGLVEPALFAVRNHPNEVVYFNALVGGPRGAFGRFELDYWGNCLYQAQQQAARLAKEAKMPVLVSGRRWRPMLLNGRRVPQVVVVRPELRRHHLEIVLLRGHPSDLRAWTSRNDLISRVTTADGTPLCTVAPGPAFAVLERALRKRGGHAGRQ